MAAGHGAGHHPGHIVAAIHVVRGRGGRFVVMMLGNGALVRSTAGGFVGGPGGTGERCVEQDDDEQTDAGVDFAAAMLKGNLHTLRQPISRIGHYIVTRHSLQD
jgi:hypothetical protein